MKNASSIEDTVSPPRAKRSILRGEVCGETCEVEVIHARAVETARSALPSVARSERLVELFGAFANTTRLRILVALRTAVGATPPELCVCELVAITGASQSMVSHQLAALRELRVVVARREGRLVYYRLADGTLARLVDDALACVPKEGAL